MPHPFLVHQLLERAARAYPEHDAIRHEDTSISYEQLARASGALARALLEAGVRRGDRVGVLLPKSIEAVVSVYAAMRAGAAYVPMDHKTPARRLALLADDCAIAALITTPDLAAALLPAMAHVPLVVIVVGEGESTGGALRYEQLVTADGPAGDDPAVIDEDLAYILYTSGSTGIPKGVMLTHRNALAFVSWAAETVGVSHADVVSSHAPLTFDLSVFDLYVAAWAGATLVLVPEERAPFGPSMIELIEHERISVWYSVPSALMLISKALEHPRAVSSLRAVVFAGEVYPTKHLRRLREQLSSATLWNLYGPTETNVCTYHRVDELPADEQTIPIGRACANTEVYAVREDGGIAGVGEVGELLVRGVTVMRGYWGRPEQTAAVLAPAPSGGVAYRTGDLVRLRPDGAYDFLGRRDHQIKSRGYRIELGDIEAALHAHPGLTDAAVIAVPHERWGNEIVAYVVPAAAGAPTDTAVKRHVLERLPRYMVPSRVEIVAELPRTLTGKVDRTLLVQAGRA